MVFFTFCLQIGSYFQPDLKPLQWTGFRPDLLWIMCVACETISNSLQNSQWFHQYSINMAQVCTKRFLITTNSCDHSSMWNLKVIPVVLPLRSYFSAQMCWTTGCTTASFTVPKRTGVLQKLIAKQLILMFGDKECMVQKKRWGIIKRDVVPLRHWNFPETSTSHPSIEPVGLKAGRERAERITATSSRSSHCHLCCFYPSDVSQIHEECLWT